MVLKFPPSSKGLITTLIKRFVMLRVALPVTGAALVDLSDDFPEALVAQADHCGTGPRVSERNPDPQPPTSQYWTSKSQHRLSTHIRAMINSY